jgi:hypothetical protein
MDFTDFSYFPLKQKFCRIQSEQVFKMTLLLVEQELLTIPELPFSRLLFVGFVLLNYDVHCLSFLSFFLSHCIVWSFHLQLMITPSVTKDTEGVIISCKWKDQRY